MADEIKTTETTEVKTETKAETTVPAPAAETKKARGRKPAAKTTKTSKAVKTEKAKAPAAKEKTEKAAVPEKRTTAGRKKATAVRTTKTTAKASAAKKNSRKAAVKVVATEEKTGISFAPVTIELDENKKYSEDALHKKVNEYLKAHPYITAKEISIFVVPKQSKAYFTVNGCSNADFNIDL